MIRKPTIHFAYTVPLGSTLLRRGLDKAIRLAGVTPLYRFGWDPLIPWRQPIRSPHCISFHLLRAFKRLGYPVRFYNILEKGVAPLGPDDIFIGQPIPDGGFGPTRSATDEKQSITSRTVREYPNNRHYLIMPYTHDPLYVSWTRELVRDNGSGGLILVGGEIWAENWETLSPLRDIVIARKKHVVMGIDTNDYPVVKKKFNPKGQRRFLYIGHTAWYKNTAELEKIAAVTPGFQGGHIGGGEVKGWKKISDFASLTPEFMSQIAKDYDIFVNTSTADAQATTILEQMCFGFVVATTRESGYNHPSLVTLSPTDTALNVATLEKLQQADEAELLAIAAANRETARTAHSWEKFCQTITDFMNL
jgi:glycosyltransferase involved in cell wall biosynthesis